MEMHKNKKKIKIKVNKISWVNFVNLVINFILFDQGIY